MSSASLNHLINLPAPTVRLDQESRSVVQPLARGGAIPVQPVYVFLTDALRDLYEDPELDARIELLRYRTKKVGSRQAGFVHPAHWVSGVNPVDDGRRTRGGGQYDDGGNPMPDRPTEFPLLGLDDWVRVGPIVVASYYAPRTVNTVNDQGDSVALGAVLGLTGRGDSNTYITTSGQNEGWYPQYNNIRMNLYLRFRVTIKDPEGDGTFGDRLTGPESATIRISPSPYPLYPNPRGGVLHKPSTLLVASFANGSSS